MVNFSDFNLVSTTAPTFTSLDCVVRCNNLICLWKQLQERGLEMLYDSLAAPDCLILSKVERPTSSLSDWLECLDIKAKICKKNVRSN